MTRRSRSARPRPAKTSRPRSSSRSSASVHSMAKSDEPVIIKKYANRRLYNTGTSTYVTLEDLASMVKAGEEFVVYDAKTGEDITRSVLTQIIFVRTLIRFYGDSMQMLVPRYLELSIDNFSREQGKFRDQMAQAFGAAGFGQLEEMARRNMEMFERAFAMFAPFGARQATNASAAATAEPGKTPAPGSDEIEDLKKQMEEMQKRISRLTDKDNP